MVRAQSYHRSFDSLADIQRLLLVLGMQGEEGVGHPAVNGELEPLLPGDGARAAQVGAPPTGGGRAQALGRGGVVQLGMLAERDDLVGRVLNRRVVGRLAPGPVEAQVAQVDAPEVADPAVLRQQERPGRFCHWPCGTELQLAASSSEEHQCSDGEGGSQHRGRWHLLLLRWAEKGASQAHGLRRKAVESFQRLAGSSESTSAWRALVRRLSRVILGLWLWVLPGASHFLGALTCSLLKINKMNQVAVWHTSFVGFFATWCYMFFLLLTYLHIYKISHIADMSVLSSLCSHE